LRLW